MITKFVKINTLQNLANYWKQRYRMVVVWIRWFTIASSPGHCHLFNVLHATSKRREWPGDEARFTMLWNKESFQLSVTVPVDIDLLKRAESTGAMVYAVSFNILVEIPSSPAALLVSSASIMSSTSSSEQSRSAGQVKGSTVIRSSALRVGTVVFLNLSPSRLALPEGDASSVSSLISVGMLVFF